MKLSCKSRPLFQSSIISRDVRHVRNKCQCLDLLFRFERIFSIVIRQYFSLWMEVIELRMPCCDQLDALCISSLKLNAFIRRPVDRLNERGLRAHKRRSYRVNDMTPVVHRSSARAECCIILAVSGLLRPKNTFSSAI